MVLAAADEVRVENDEDDDCHMLMQMSPLALDSHTVALEAMRKQTEPMHPDTLHRRCKYMLRYMLPQPQEQDERTQCLEALLVSHLLACSAMLPTRVGQMSRTRSGRFNGGKPSEVSTKSGLSFYRGSTTYVSVGELPARHIEQFGDYTYTWVRAP